MSSSSSPRNIGDDGRGRFLRAETVVVRRRDGDAACAAAPDNHPRAWMNARTGTAETVRSRLGVSPGAKQVLAGVGGQRPVVVLAGAVDAGKGLFMQQADQAVARGHLLHDLHRQLVLVGGDVAGRDRPARSSCCAGRDLVVLGLGVERRASRAPRPDPS